jgi:acetyl esterase/lipase
MGAVQGAGSLHPAHDGEAVMNGAPRQSEKVETRTDAAYYEARQTHGAVEVMTLGEGMQRVYVFLPAQPSVKGEVPMVMFLHGWQGMNPKNYGALLDHLAREGEVVIYPVYQETDATNPQIVVPAAAEVERRALAALKERGIEPDPQRVVDFGYSMGVAISLKLAAIAKEDRLPVPQAMVLAAPGDAYHVALGAKARSIWPTHDAMKATFAKTMPVAIVTGEDDKAIGLPTGRKLAAELCDVIPADRLLLLVLPSDEHGGKKVNAGHASPGAPDSRYDFELKVPAGEIPKLIAGRAGFEESASLNQLDFYGYWRVLDALIDSLAVKPVVVPVSVFGDARGVKGFHSMDWYLGTWADGTPYKAGHTENACHIM